MLGKNLSEALSDISDDKIEAAANYAPKGRRQLWVRVAACAAVLALLLTYLLWPTAPIAKVGEIIAVSGVVKAYACDLEDVDATKLDAYELTEGVNSIRPVWCPVVNWLSSGIPLSFQVPDDCYGSANITMDIIVDYGEFYIWDNGKQIFVGDTMTIDNGETIFWGAFDDRKVVVDNVGLNGNFYADIIIRADDQTVGYGVITFLYTEDRSLPLYFVEGFVAFSFPMVDGELQDVSEEYVRERIEEYKQKNVGS